MGTNFYAHLNTCKCCGRPEKELHLGKSSGGWKFCFQYNGGGYEGALSLMDIDSGEVFQSDPVKELYPNDRGRN